ncbi:MAG TPA: hypothetical protein VEJ89_08695 [Myxococcaceae bacterium]|nr:hypothetical protein [Myxococcaceae bacterium]
MNARRRRLLWAACAASLAGCGPGLTLTTAPTAAQSVCMDVDDCSQGGDFDWLQSCEAQAQSLGQQATASGCGSLYDSYYACADSHYSCQGATALFPGCDAQRAALEACLNAASAQSACAEYDARLASCPPPTGTSPPGNPIPTPCSLNLQCQAHCYLSNVGNVCAPGLTELGAFSACAGSCPP